MICCFNAIILIIMVGPLGGSRKAGKNWVLFADDGDLIANDLQIFLGLVVTTTTSIVSCRSKTESGRQCLVLAYQVVQEYWLLYECNLVKICDDVCCSIQFTDTNQAGLQSLVTKHPGGSGIHWAICQQGCQKQLTCEKFSQDSRVHVVMEFCLFLFLCPRMRTCSISPLKFCETACWWHDSLYKLYLFDM